MTPTSIPRQNGRAKYAFRHILLFSPDLRTVASLPLPSPDLKNPRHTEDRPRVGGELIEVRHDAFDFLP